jgi:glutaredoxin 2
MELYHYLHCPYCIRIRMAWGYLGVNYKSIVLGYSDEKTPIELMGKKMLPIARLADGRIMNESLDIIAATDVGNRLDLRGFTGSVRQAQIEAELNALSKPLFNLCMPFFALSAEFGPEDRTYFVEKKSKTRGPFSELLKNRSKFETEIAPLLKLIEAKISSYYQSPILRIEDILIASHLWGLYMVPEFRLSDVMHQYLQRVKLECHFDPWLEYGAFFNVSS